MKKILLLAVLGFFSCRKESELRQVRKDIIGKWEIEMYSGYPFTQPAYPLGNGQIIVIKEDGVFERRKHDTLVFAGHYFVQRKKDCSERNSDIILLTDESSVDPYRYVTIENGELALSTPNCYQDGGTAYYRRLD